MIFPPDLAALMTPALVDGISALIGSIAGGSLVFLALRERLRDTFPSLEDLDTRTREIHGHLSRLEKAASTANDRSARNDDRIGRLEERVSMGAQRTDEVVSAIRAIQETVSGHSAEFSAIQEGLKGLGRSIDLLRQDLRRN